MKNITGNAAQYKKQMEYFFNSLESEKKYFNLTMERLLKWELIMIEVSGDEIIAVAGLEKKWGIVRNNLMIKKEHQGRGLGKQIIDELVDEIKKKYAMVMAVISEQNSGSIKLHLQKGYRRIGRRQTLDYLIKPINQKGVVVYFLMKTFFPFLKVADMIRR